MTLPVTLRAVRRWPYVTPSPSRSFVSLSRTTVPGDGTTPVTVFITLRQDGEDNDENNALFLEGIPPEAIVVSVSGSGHTVTQPTQPTNASGTTTASFVTTADDDFYTVTVTVRGIPMNDQPAIEVGGEVVPPDEGEPFFEETFAGGTLNNANGFTWNTGKSTAVVTFDAAPALRFRYTTTGSAEQRFNMGRDLPELWVQYHLWVPTNFKHPEKSPNNNKFCMLWNTVYGSGSGTWQVGHEYTRAADTASLIRVMSTTQYDLFVTSSVSRTGGGWVNPDNAKPFIGGTGPVAIGAWSQIRLHAKASSAADAADGVWEMWVNGTLFARATGVLRNYDDVGETVLRNGYFMGSANSKPEETTDWYLRGFKFYDTDPGWE